jgi:ribosomal protein S11
MKATVSNSSKRSRAARQRGDVDVNPKALAAKFAAKIAAKKLEKEKQKKRMKEIKKVMTSTVMPTVYEVRALLPENTFRFRKQYDPRDDKPIGVFE